MSDSKYKITVVDNIDFYVGTDFVSKSSTLKQMLADKSTIVLPNIDAQTFMSILNITSLMKPVSSIMDREKLTESINGLNCNALMDIIHASHYLNMQPLLDITSKRFKYIIDSNDADNIRKQFKIKNDFTIEEQTLVDRNFEWR